jgi:nucleotide-binding universal stress UspA family protein
MEGSMSGIVCAIRGCPASRPTIEKSIQLAGEAGLTLYFLYVIDTRFLDKIAEPILVDPEEGITKMGEILLLIAKERAEEQGVQAETIHLRGEVRQVLKEAARKEEVDVIILGSPSGEKSVFDAQALVTFAAEIETETGIQTKIV